MRNLHKEKIKCICHIKASPIDIVDLVITTLKNQKEIGDIYLQS